MIQFYEIELLNEYTTSNKKFYKKGARLLAWEDTVNKCYWTAPCFQAIKETPIPLNLANKIYEWAIVIKK